MSFTISIRTSLRRITHHNPILTTSTTLHQNPLPHNHQSRTTSSRSRRGLYDGVDIRTGNNVSFSKRATKRTYKPNVFRKHLYSEILDEKIRFVRVSTKALRTMDKMGGLDEYLLRSPYVKEGEGQGGLVKGRILERLRESEIEGGESVLGKVSLPDRGVKGREVK